MTIMPRIAACLLLPVVLCIVTTGALEYPYVGSFGDANCTGPTKQTALYLSYDMEPPLKEEPAFAVRVQTTWRNVSDIRRYGANGVFASHPWHTTDGGGGYFGSQVDGSLAGNGGGALLFSTWDDNQPHDPCNFTAPNATWCNHKHAFPLASNCDRHCLDCGLHKGWRNTTGTQCSLNLNVTDGDSIVFVISQTKVNSTYVFEDHTYLSLIHI